MDLILENIRCFSGRHTIPIKPLTLLTGENSSGKSTFLAALSTVFDGFGFPIRPRFNEAPYNLGNFDTIATVKGPRSGGRVSSFSLGYKDAYLRRQSRSGIVSTNNEVVATYIGKQGLVEVSKIAAINSTINAEMIFTGSDSDFKVEIVVTRNGSRTVIPVPTTNTSRKIGRMDVDEFLFFALYNMANTAQGRKRSPDEKMLNELRGVFGSTLNMGQVLSIAPIRTKPKRTYDQVIEEFSPEGDHIPFVISNILADPSTNATLERFGQESGLFKHITVRKLGKNVSDPRQVLVANSSRPVNLVDVGYGVSQVLPVIVQSVLAASENLLLLQQPEVHLHPRAQAALGTLFVNLMKGSKKQFVIETHSDYIINRIRQEIAKGNISPEMVGILYFEKKGNDTQAHPLSLDEQGNILDAPSTYRDFFMLEEINLFNRTEL